MKDAGVETIWKRISRDLVMFKANAHTEIYDEPALRKLMIGFLSDDSKARYDTYAQYYNGLEWFMTGLKLFLTDFEPADKIGQ